MTLTPSNRLSVSSLVFVVYYCLICLHQCILTAAKILLLLLIIVFFLILIYVPVICIHIHFVVIICPWLIKLCACSYMTWLWHDMAMNFLYIGDKSKDLKENKTRIFIENYIITMVDCSFGRECSSDLFESSSHLFSAFL